MLGEALADKDRSVGNDVALRKIVLAYGAFDQSLPFLPLLRASMQRDERSVLAPLVYVMLYTAEHELCVPHVFHRKALTLAFNLKHQIRVAEITGVFVGEGGLP